jgi:transcriptional regulator with XRE-family HTH domain
MRDLTKTTINGEQLKIAREIAGLTQHEVAVKIGVNKQTISSYENGHGFPSANVFLRLCMLYGIDARNFATAQNN